MTREEGIRLVNLYDGSYSQAIVEEFCRYIDISESQFWDIIDKFYNKELFDKKSNGNYVPKFVVGGWIWNQQK